MVKKLYRYIKFRREQRLRMKCIKFIIQIRTNSVHNSDVIIHHAEELKKYIQTSKNT
jgi:hypothetical protein